MIFGSGLIANAFKNYLNDENIIIFASGVSNSLEKSVVEFDREKKLLQQVLSSFKGKCLVYFSTCSIYDPCQANSQYVIHKIAMENLIVNTAQKYHIFRLPQVVGYSHNSTLVNFLFKALSENIEIQIYSLSTRNLIAVEDIFTLVDSIIKNHKYLNETLNIASPFNLDILQIIRMIESITERKAKYIIKEEGCPVKIEIDALKKEKKFYEIFQKNYTYEILKNYFLNYRQEFKL